jgi:hypothetical protein
MSEHLIAIHNYYLLLEEAASITAAADQLYLPLNFSTLPLVSITFAVFEPYAG